MDGEKYWNEPRLKPTQAKLQHYVPRLFLRAFATDDKIRVTDLDNGREYWTSVEKAAAESHFYNENIADMYLSSEDWLAELEGNAAPVLRKLVNDPNSITSLPIEEEVCFTRFLAALRFRTPAFREYTDKLSDSLIEKTKEKKKKQIYHQNTREKANSIWKEIKDKPDHWWYNDSAPRQPAGMINFMLGEVQGFANLLRAAPWCIGFVPDSIQLYTSDNPVASYLRAVRPWWERASFSSLTYFIPLSPKILLRIERRPDQKKGEKLQPQGERHLKDFSEWEISFAQHVVTRETLRHLYGEGQIIPRDCASTCLERIDQAQLDFAVEYLGFDPRPPKRL